MLIAVSLNRSRMLVRQEVKESLLTLEKKRGYVGERIDAAAFGSHFDDMSNMS